MNWTVWLNLGSCVLNLVLSGWSLRRGHQHAVSLAAIKTQYEAVIQSLLPAVGVCWMLAEDPNVPEAWRAIARQAIPDGTKVTPSPPADKTHVH